MNYRPIRFSNLEFDEHKNWDESAYDYMPHGFIYSGFHHNEVSAWVEIKAYAEKEMVASIKIVRDDIIRYDEKAKDNEINGVCTMTRSSMNDMWAP